MGDNSCEVPGTSPAPNPLLAGLDGNPESENVCRLDPQKALEWSLAGLQSDAANFGARFIQDSAVRLDYLKNVKQFSDEALAAVGRGEITAHEAMLSTHAMRNELMELARLKTSDIGLAQAQALKSTGVTLEKLMEKYAQKLFGKAFTELAEAQRGQVYLTIVESAGRANPTVTLRAVRLARLGKGLWVFTAAVAIYNIATADDKVVAVVREGAVIGGGMAGGAAGGAAAGLFCGPGAPVCVTIGVFVGGAIGAIGADKIVDEVVHSKELIKDQINRILVPSISIPGKPAPFCFAASTTVDTTAGPRPIASIRPGDWVLGYDVASRLFGRTRVVAVDVHPGEFKLLSVDVPGSEPIAVTAGHWFHTGNEWVLSEELGRAGRALSIRGPVEVAVTGPERSGPIKVYNLQTRSGTYLVGDSGLVVSGVVLPQIPACRRPRRVPSRLLMT